MWNMFQSAGGPLRALCLHAQNAARSQTAPAPLSRGLLTFPPRATPLFITLLNIHRGLVAFCSSPSRVDGRTGTELTFTVEWDLSGAWHFPKIQNVLECIPAEVNLRAGCFYQPFAFPAHRNAVSVATLLTSFMGPFSVLHICKTVTDTTHARASWG